MLPFDDEPRAPTYSVGDVCDRIHDMLARAFPGEIWVQGEIHNLKSARNGYGYLDLVETSTHGRVRARLGGVLKPQDRRRVERTLARAGSLALDDGIEVRVRCRVEYYTPFGRLQLVVRDIDPEFLLGRLAADRDRLVAALRAEGLLDRNRTLPMPVLPLRVGLVTSADSAAHHDFMAEITASGIGFRILLADTRVQGTDAERTIPDALARLARHRPDVIVVVRGGGSRTDLVAFDREPVARAIASTPVPVVVGVGHETDESVADHVAHLSVKTPTAAAATLVARVESARRRTEELWDAVAAVTRAATLAARNRVDGAARAIGSATRTGLSMADHQLTSAVSRLGREAPRRLDQADHRLTSAVSRLGREAPRRLDQADHQLRGAGRDLIRDATRIVTASTTTLDTLDAALRAHDPARILARGWSITTDGSGRLVRSVAGLEPGETTITRVADGRITGTVTGISENTGDA